MRLFLLFIFVHLHFFSEAQSNYPLHPSVGDTIDQFEKLDYSLFPFLDNSTYHNSFIRYKEAGYFLVVTDTNTLKKEVLITKEQLIEAQRNIEKVNTYYRYLANKKPDSIPIISSVARKKTTYPIRLEGPMSEQMKKEARMQIRLKEDAQRRRDFEQGFNDQRLYIEFK